ncbi:MAG: class I SAM-dependent methyltransferase [Anaerolineae bacterium]|nr:class I SAM-dependent methyltransferase [Anaerolineae bacterium]
MDTELDARLLELNRRFYSEFAARFSASRATPWPGFIRLLPYLPDGAHVVDLGCGNGRLACFLDKHRRDITYLGLDFSPDLLALAREATAHLSNVAAAFRIVNLADPGWTEAVQGRRFDAVLALAVLQHIPGFERRLELLRQAAALLRPGGVLALANWQFTSVERLRRKVVPWSRVGIDPDGLEDGDYLLEWRQGGVAYRYCHLVNEEEVRALAAAAGLELAETFRADGKEGDLNLYAVLRPACVGCGVDRFS